MEDNTNKKHTRTLILLIVNTLLFFVVYRVLLYYAAMSDNTLGSFVVMVVYLFLLLGFVLAYLIYNRFFYRRGLTPEQLPDDWSAEQKTEFLADGERRMARSKWMLLIILPLIVTFLFDAVDLFIIDPFFRK
ncbi:MAG: hypothetical protein IJA78_00115 [Clostridia bacterium]|nr:hypothetical protein [Clostridia bacterium]